MPEKDILIQYKYEHGEVNVTFFPDHTGWRKSHVTLEVT